jgi:hypothetical protein
MLILKVDSYVPVISKVGRVAAEPLGTVHYFPTGWNAAALRKPPILVAYGRPLPRQSNLVDDEFVGWPLALKALGRNPAPVPSIYRLLSASEPYTKSSQQA